KQETYHDLGSNYFDRRNSEATAKRLVRRLEQLGYAIHLEQSMPIVA
ncbi:MAG: hypothetical protein HYZ22_05740, partial [Chloroflexi bacterium]|nr:hypothetical protein [Chloroflexota bacterium]